MLKKKFNLNKQLKKIQKKGLHNPKLKAISIFGVALFTVILCASYAWFTYTSGYSQAFSGSATKRVKLKVVGKLDNSTIGTLNDKILSSHSVTTPTTKVGQEVSGATEKVLASAEDDYGTSYYFRGAITNNYVKFAGFVWRIVRINGDGSIRLVLDGTLNKTYYNDEQKTDIGTNVRFDDQYEANKYVGYSYDASSDNVNALVTKNSTDSTIKKAIDKFYEDYLKEYYSQFISDTLFCNDRSVSTGSGTGTTTTQYGAYKRQLSNTTSLKCEQKNDRYTVEDKSIGNGALKYPIGLLTYDEVVNAGAYFQKENRSFYLYNSLIDWNNYYTMSPQSFQQVTGGNSTILYYSEPGWSVAGSTVRFGPAAIRPVINLKANTIVKGSGTESTPYEIVGSVDFPNGDKTTYNKNLPMGVYYNSADYKIEKVTCDNGVNVHYGVDTGEAYPMIVQYLKADLTTCTVNFKETLSHAILANNVLKTEVPNFKKGEPPASGENTGSGLYQTEENDDYGGPSYYFRGDKSKLKNNVEFGGQKWKIVRINGDGSIRLVLVSDFTDSSHPLNIGDSPFNGYQDDTTAKHEKVGFTYNNSKSCTKASPCQVNFAPVATSATYAFTNTHGGNNSYIKTSLENWYYKNLKEFDSKIEYGTFCNDVSYGSGTDNGTSATLYYGAYERVYNTSSPSYGKPTLQCPEPNNSSWQARKYGGIYKTKIGLLTADEMNMAGLSYGVPYAKSSNYLYYSSDWWSLSPYSSDIYPRVFQGHNGNFVNFYASYSKAVVPVINLKKDVTISSGNGSTSSPFVVN